MARISRSPGSMNSVRSGSASRNTPREITRQKAIDAMTALLIPSRIRASFPAPKFCATKVEKALPKSCTGI